MVDAHVVSSAKLACDVVPRALTIADTAVFALVVQAVSVESVGAGLRAILLHELIGPSDFTFASSSRDDAQHLSVLDLTPILIDDESIWLDEHADPIIEIIDPELRDDVEAEAPAQRALPDVDAVLGAPEVPEGLGCLVVEAALHAVVVRAQVASL